MLAVKMSVMLLHCSQNLIFKCNCYPFYFGGKVEFMTFVVLLCAKKKEIRQIQERNYILCIVKMSIVYHVNCFSRLPHKREALSV